jgi:hypothetical protein
MASRSWVGRLCVAAAVLGMIGPAAYGSVSGRKNSVILLGVATVVTAAEGKGTEALLLGAGTYYAYRRYKDAKGRTRYRRIKVRCQSPPGWREGRKKGTN